MDSELVQLEAECEVLRQERDIVRAQCAEGRAQAALSRQKLAEAQNKLDYLRSEISDAGRALARQRSIYGEKGQRVKSQPSSSEPATLEDDMSSSSNIFSIKALRQSIDNITEAGYDSEAPWSSSGAQSTLKRKFADDQSSYYLDAHPPARQGKQCVRCKLESNDKERLCTGVPGRSCPQCRAKHVACSFVKSSPTKAPILRKQTRSATQRAAAIAAPQTNAAPQTRRPNSSRVASITFACKTSFEQSDDDIDYPVDPRKPATKLPRMEAWEKDIASRSIVESQKQAELMKKIIVIRQQKSIAG